MHTFIIINSYAVDIVIPTGIYFIQERRQIGMKVLGGILGGVGSFCAVFAAVGIFVWIARKASILMKAVK